MSWYIYQKILFGDKILIYKRSIFSSNDLSFRRIKFFWSPQGKDNGKVKDRATYGQEEEMLGMQDPSSLLPWL